MDSFVGNSVFAEKVYLEEVVTNALHGSSTVLPELLPPDAFNSEVVQQACFAVLHHVFSDPLEISSNNPVTDSNASLVTDRLCVSVEPLNSSVRQANVDSCDIFSASELAVERPSLLHFDEQLLHLSDVNNNNNNTNNNNNNDVIRNESDDNRFISSDCQTNIQSSVHSHHDPPAVVRTDSIVVSTEDGRTTGTLEPCNIEESVSRLLIIDEKPQGQSAGKTCDTLVDGDGGTSSVCSVEASVLLPLVVNEEPQQQNDEKTSVVLADEFSDSDMFVDVDCDDLEGTGYISLDAVDDSEGLVGSDIPCEKEQGYGIHVAASEMVSVPDEEPPQKVQKLAEAASSGSSSQSSSASSSDVTSQSRSSSGSSLSSDASNSATSTTESASASSSNSTSSSKPSSSAASKPRATNNSDRVNSAAASNIATQSSPTPGTAAISVRQAPASGTTSDGLISFSASSTSDRKPSGASSRPSRFTEHSSMAVRGRSRMHPYRPAQRTSSRRPNSTSSFSFKRYDTHRNVDDLLECHSASLYKQRQQSKVRVNPRILVEVVKRKEAPAFTSYIFRRATRLETRRILGDTDVKDDLEDMPFTASDITDFDEKKRMAEELDSRVGQKLQKK